MESQMLSGNKNLCQGAEGIGLLYKLWIEQSKIDWAAFSAGKNITSQFSVYYLYTNTCTNWWYPIPLYNGDTLHEEPDLYYNYLVISLNADALKMIVLLASHLSVHNL